MRLGIGSYTYPWGVGVPGYPAPTQPLTPQELLRRAGTLGVRVVQIADNLPLDRLSNSELDRLRCQAEELGIVLEAGTSGVDPVNLRRYIAIARRLRASLLRTVIDTAMEQPAPDDVVARLSPLLPEFKEAGVTLALENHDRLKAATLLEIVNRIGGDEVGICLDTANSFGCMEGPEHVVATLGPRVVNLHIKDVRIFRPPHLKGFVIEGRPAGQGQLDIPMLLRCLREAGANPNVILELWVPPASEMADVVAMEVTWARQSLDYLRTLVPA